MFCGFGQFVKDYGDVIVAGLALIPATVVAIFSKRLIEFEQSRSDWDLFEERRDLYKAASEAIGTISQHGHFLTADQKRYRSAIADARWFVSADAVTFLENELGDVLTHVAALSERLQTEVGLSSEQRADIGKQRLDLAQRVIASRERLSQVFEPYLNMNR